MGHEVDAMKCSACGNEERASEGYPCESCGNFICLICSFKGVKLCRECEAKAEKGAAAPGKPSGEASGEASGEGTA
jgi:hypothetical protein